MGIKGDNILDLIPVIMNLGGVGHESDTLELLKTASEKGLIGETNCRGERIWGLRSKPAEDQ
jgi:hypothetical protein